MNKKLNIYIGIFILVIGLLMYLEYTKPKPIDWTPSYSSKDKIPFGTYILSKETAKLFPDKTIKFIEQTPASYLKQNKNQTNSAYLFFYKTYKNTPTITDIDAEYLLDFVQKGNDVFIASNNIPQSILDSLNLDTENSNYILKDENLNTYIYLVDPSFKNIQYHFKKISYYYYFSKIDSAKTITLGEYKNSKHRKANFIKQKYGNGYFYLNLFPEAYSNYFMLNDSNYTYTINSLNYINKKNILWEEHSKSINSLSEGPLTHIFNNPALHWAWAILIISTLFYFIFFGKRLQRIIPIITPLKNSTLEFTQTIGNLYYNNRNHQDIIHKKIKYFLYFVKDRYYMEVENIDDSFSEKLHLKSGVSKEITDKIVFLIQRNKNTPVSSESDLKTLNSTIDLFYKKIN